MSIHTEINFENDICDHLATHGWLYEEGDAQQYDRSRALYPDDLVAGKLVELGVVLIRGARSLTHSSTFLSTVGAQGQRRVAAADVDQDGDLDIFVSGSSTGVAYHPNRTVWECLANLEDRCVLEFFDVSLFLSHFTNADSSADLNVDGHFDSFDVSVFLSAFNAGCP